MRGRGQFYSLCKCASPSFLRLGRPPGHFAPCTTSKCFKTCLNQQARVISTTLWYRKYNYWKSKTNKHLQMNAWERKGGGGCLWTHLVLCGLLWIFQKRRKRKQTSSQLTTHFSIFACLSGMQTWKRTPPIKSLFVFCPPCKEQRAAPWHARSKRQLHMKSAAERKSWICPIC